MFWTKTSYRKIGQIENSGLRIVYNELHMPLEGLLNHDQGISDNRKHINTLLTEICKTFEGENPYLMKSISMKKNVIYNLRISTLLALP